jgi:hypothetical protein
MISTKTGGSVILDNVKNICILLRDVVHILPHHTLYTYQPLQMMVPMVYHLKQNKQVQLK